MNLTLRKDDRRAVDLLLDRSAKAAANGDAKAQGVYASAELSLGERIVRAQKLLQLLDLLPGDEPPADLVARTLRFVEEAAYNPHGVRTHVPHLFNSERPVA